MTTPTQRVQRAIELRVELARLYATLPIPEHISNADDDRYATENYFASYTKGLPHPNPLGEVDPKAYRALLRALETGEPADFADVPLGGLNDPNTRQPLTDPQCGLAFDLEGIDSHLLTIPPAFAFASPGAIGEIAENYWLALARDVAFADYGTGAGTDLDTPNGSLTAHAAADLSKYAVFNGPKSGGAVTVGTLFRGMTTGDLVGPYVSQFLLLDVPFGSERFEQKIAFAVPEQNFMTQPADWLAVQQGAKPAPAPTFVATPKYLYRGRDLGNYVHIDELYQAYLNACLLLISPNSRGGLGAPLNPGNPYPGSNQVGFGTLGEPNFKVLVAEVATRALKAVWFQKWFVHRRPRPELYAGRIHHKLAATPGADKYPFHPGEFAKLQAAVLPKVLAKNSGASHLLPMAFPEGSPTHPAYGAGHATVAGACITVLKALFDGDALIKPLIEAAQRSMGGNWFVAQPNNDGTMLVPYGQPDADQMTVGGELEKLAGNVGLARNFAGVHWRSDYWESLKLGEQVALNFLRETVMTYNESAYFTIRKLDGTQVQITKTGFE